MKSKLLKIFNWFLRYLKENKKKTVIILSIVTVFFISFTYVAVEATSTVEFCILCHEMEPQHDSWLKSSHYDKKKDEPLASCRDCHVRPWSHPLGVIYDKTYHGLKDVFWHVVKTEEELMLPISKQMWKIHAAEGISSSSCLKCHKDVIYDKEKKGYLFHKNFNKNKNSSCTDCHKNLVHD